MYPQQRPSAAQVYNVLSRFRTTEELLEELELRVQSIEISFTGRRRRRFYVKLKYGNEVYKTPLTTRAAAGDEYTWFVIHPTLPSLLSSNLRDRDYPKAWLIKTKEHDYGRSVPFEVLSPVGVFEEDEVCAKGHFSVSPSPSQLPTWLIVHIQLRRNANKQSRVKLKPLGSTSKAVLKIFLT